MSQVRRIDQIPQILRVSPNDRIALWQDGRTRIGTVADIFSSLLDFPGATASQAALITILDGLPPLPADPAEYPAAGGLFRNGDSSGYSVIRLYPKA